MNTIHTGVLALVMSIFLIQAIDPPLDKNSGSLLQYGNNAAGGGNNFLPVFQTAISDLGSQPLKAPSAKLLNNNKSVEIISGANKKSTIDDNTDILKVFHHYLTQIKTSDTAAVSTPRTTNPSNINEDNVSSSSAINAFLRREQKTAYEKLLEQDFVKPLLKLYTKSQVESNPEPDYVIPQKSDDASNTNNNTTSTSRISKEDYVDDFKVLSKDELDLLLHSGETYQHNDNFEDVDQDVKIARRDDSVGIDNNEEQEHIGEILPSNYAITTILPPQSAAAMRRHRFAPKRRQLYQYNNNKALSTRNYHPNNNNIRTSRTSYEYDETFHQPSSSLPSNPFVDAVRYRKPVVTFPGESRFRAEYEPTADAYETVASSEAVAAYHQQPRGVNLPPAADVSGFRVPRRLRGYRAEDSYPQASRDAYYDQPPSRWNGAWITSRRPRVIFPSDLVTFRDQNAATQDEPDWLAGDNNLQDIQESESVKDRGKDEGWLFSIYILIL